MNDLKRPPGPTSIHIAQPQPATRAVPYDEVVRLLENYGQLTDRLFADRAIDQREREQLHQSVEDLRTVAVQASEDCAERTDALANRVNELASQVLGAVGCVQTQREYVEELEVKIKRMKRELRNSIDEVTDAVAERTGNTGKFDADNVKAAAEAVVNERQRQELEKSAERRHNWLGTVAASIVTATLLAMGALIWSLVSHPTSTSAQSAPAIVVPQH